MTEAELVRVFKELAAASLRHLELELTEGTRADESWCSVFFMSESRAASAAVWTRPHVGGLLDFEVIDDTGAQLLCDHLEGPDENAIRTAWKRMLDVFLAYE